VGSYDESEDDDDNDDDDDDSSTTTPSCEQDVDEDNNLSNVREEAILSQDLRNLTLEPSGGNMEKLLLTVDANEEETATLQEQSQKSSTISRPRWI